MEDKIFKKLLEHDKKFEQIDKRFVENDKKFEILIKRSMYHDDRFDQMDKNFTIFRDEMNTRFDQILSIVQRLDQERLFTFELYKRLEKDMERVKKILKIV